MAPNAKSADTRFIQAGAFALGALALYLLIDRGSLKFYWTPGTIGVAYLLAAIAGGKRGGHWPTALVLVGWGAVVIWVGETRPANLDIAGLYFAGGGAGVLVAGLLHRLGFAIDVIGLGLAALFAGLVLAFSGRVDQFVDAGFYALLLALVAVVNVALGFMARRRPTTA
jgi:hypothetical protein